ncbi:hypothetical protein Scep_005458 [Stephania cephalantha]|uniref:Mitochondrial glycoprotein n=1 Tax=Stephania cephalantha TaxID=152367 RepID=A0AAP0KVZ6_9MAGN
MNLSNTLRRAASSIAPLSIRAFRDRRIQRSSSIFDSSNTNGGAAHELLRKTFLPGARFASSSSKPSLDQDLIRVIDSEIQCAEEEEEENRNSVEEIPDGFPFEIVDNRGERTVSLRREYEGEVIDVEVHMPDYVDDNEEGNDENENAEDGGESSMAMVATICKRDGTCLELGCTAYADDISIDSLIVKNADTSEDVDAYEGPEFSALDEQLQKALHKYLEIRGIEPSTTNFLHEYMIKKDGKEYLMWLKEVKKFIEK